MELRTKLDGVGRKVSPSVLTLGLVDLQDKLAGDPWFPFSLMETGTQWTLVPKHEALEVLAGDGKIHPRTPLNEAELTVLSIVAFSNGISKKAIQQYIGHDPSAALERLRTENLIYAIPGAAFDYWRPSREILRRFGLRRFSEIPGYKDFHAYLHGRKSLDDAQRCVEKELRKSKRKREQKT